MTIFLWFHVLPYIRHLLYIHLSLSLSFPPISLPSAFFASCLCHKSLGVREGEREGEEERGRHTCLQATPPPPSPSHSGYLRYGPRQENIPQIFLSGRPLKWYCYVLQSIRARDPGEWALGLYVCVVRVSFSSLDLHALPRFFVPCS